MARQLKVQSEAVDGSASAPAYSFESDSDTGVYRVSSDVLGVATGGTQRYIVSSAGIEVAGDVSYKHGTSRSTSMMDLEVLNWM